jgi:hypothetical protein
MKLYIVYLKSAPTKHWYSVEAPNRRIARWCGYNLFCNEYLGEVSLRDFGVKRDIGE